MVDASAFDASRRNLLRYATLITLFMRHGANAIVCAVVLAMPPTSNTLAGGTLAAGLGAWSIYRMITHSPGRQIMAVDYATTIAACLATPILVSGPHFYLSNSAPVAIAGTAVICFTISTPVRVSLVLTAGIATAFATGAAEVVGWGHVGAIFNLYYFALQWLTAALIRLMVVRVADSVDSARADRLTAELDHEVNAAVREYDREQMRLLHDTVASTLLMVGAGTALSPQRLAAQARRDLQVFADTPMAPADSADLVAALRDNAIHIDTPVQWAGTTALWLDGTTATTIAAVAREALTNVDRHANATQVIVTISAGLVRIVDNGRGFDVTEPSRGHGIANSITARMRTLGGDATVMSRPGHGTTVELRWHRDPSNATEPPGDPERLIERARTGYGLALTAYAITNLAAMMPAALNSARNPALQWALISITAVSALSAIPTILGRPTGTRRWVALMLLAVSLIQPVSLPIDQLGTPADWSQAVIGWCILPLLLNERLRDSAGLLISCWAIPALYALIRDPTAHTIVNLGYGTASILTVQLCTLFFDNLIRRAARAAGTDTAARMRLIAAESIAAAVQAEYRRRYANLADTISPLLTVLAEHGRADQRIHRRAQIEYQRLRTLFDQSSAFDHRLLGVLRPHIDSAQDRGIDVTVNVNGTLPPIDDTITQRLAHLLERALAVTTVSARITVTGEPNTVELSIACRGVHDADTFAPPTCSSEDELELTALDDTVWITVRHILEGKQHSDALTRHTH
jgi:signal transduction histidine kinase